MRMETMETMDAREAGAAKHRLEADAIKTWIRAFLRRPEENLLWESGEEPAFAEPLIGFSRGDDPLYEGFKQQVGPFHWTPLEIFRLSHPQEKAAAAGLTVISYILPQTESTKADNRACSRFPSERWARARIFGEAVNDRLRRHLVARLQAAGHAAVAPALTAEFSKDESGPYGRASTWSERHAAFASGLGTFGLCDGLITSAGKAMRAGSVVVRAAIPPTPRPYQDHRAYCLYFSEGTCGDCIKRCPVGAVSARGHDKLRCAEYLFPVTEDYVRKSFGFDGYGCGLCQTGVPCESGIPVPGRPA
jgi:epoxyqueuosine reductase